MRKYLFVLLLLTQLPARASQIVVGIWSKSLLAWDIWERDKQLTHHLLLRSAASQPVTVEIRLRRYRDVHDQLVLVPTGKVLYRGKLRPGQLTPLKYPKSGSENGYMEFFENGKRVGLLEINARKPAASLVHAGLRYYTNTSADAGPLGYWLGFESLYAGPSRLVLFRPKGYDEEYQLVKT